MYENYYLYTTDDECDFSNFATRITNLLIVLKSLSVNFDNYPLVLDYILQIITYVNLEEEIFQNFSEYVTELSENKTKIKKISPSFMNYLKCKILELADTPDFSVVLNKLSEGFNLDTKLDWKKTFCKLTTHIFEENKIFLISYVTDDDIAETIFNLNVYLSTNSLKASGILHLNFLDFNDIKNKYSEMENFNQMIAETVVTIMHEIFHCYRILVYSNFSYYKKTPKNSIEGSNPEIGEYFEQRIPVIKSNLKKIHCAGAILDPNEWNKIVDEGFKVENVKAKKSMVKNKIKCAMINKHIYQSSSINISKKREHLFEIENDII